MPSPAGRNKTDQAKRRTGVSGTMPPIVRECLRYTWAVLYQPPKFDIESGKYQKLQWREKLNVNSPDALFLMLKGV